MVIARLRALRVVMVFVAILGLTLNMSVQYAYAAGPANSPWPLWGHDVRNTMVGAASGPQNPAVKWIAQPVPLSQPASDLYFPGPVIVDNDRIYVLYYENAVGSSDPMLVAYTRQGGEIWRYILAPPSAPFKSDVSGPVVGDDGTLYVALLYRSYSEQRLKVYAVTSYGVKKWDVELSLPSATGSIIGGWLTGLTLDNGGILFVGVKAEAITTYWGYRWMNTVAIDSTTGKVLWKNFYWSNAMRLPIAVHPADGSILMGVVRTDSSGQSGPGSLLAYLPNGTLKFYYQSSSGYSPSFPVVGADGTIYVRFGSQLVALKSDGTEKWTYNFGSSYIDSPYVAPVVYANKVYIAVAKSAASMQVNVHDSVSGTLLKRLTISLPASYNDGVISIDQNGIAYIGLTNGQIVAYDLRNETVKWIYGSPGSPAIARVPIAIDSDGTLYVRDVYNRVLAIGPPPIDRLEVSPSSVVVPKGKTQQLAVTVVFSNGSSQDVTSLASYSSSNPAVVGVTSDGQVIGVGVGNAVVTVWYQEKSVSVPVEVTQAVAESISVFPSAVYLGVGQTQQLTVTAIMSDGSTRDVTASAGYVSSDASVATVSPGGLITGVAQGSAVVTVSYQGKTASVPVEVGQSSGGGSGSDLIAGISVADGASRLVNGRTVWFVRNDIVTLEITFTGNGPYQVKYDPGSGNWYDWQELAGPTSNLVVVLTKAQGANLVRVQAKTGQTAETYELTIVVDPTPPVVFKLRGINGATASATSSAVLELEAGDNLPYALEYRFRVNDGAWSAWNPLDGDTFSVAGLASGANRIVVEVRDAAGNTSRSAATLFGIF